MNKTKKILSKEFAIKLLFGIAAVFSILAALTIFIFLFARGIPAFEKIGVFEFLFGKVWMPDGNDTYAADIVAGQYGIAPMIMGSIYAALGALAVGGPVGFFTAVFLSKFCPKKLKGVLTQFINLLAGIPSVIYGFFGYKVLSPLLGIFSPTGDGTGLLSVSLILGLMIMPTVVALSKTSLDAVPENYYEGARALGNTHSQAVFGAAVPAAKSGIAASLILGLGRAVGETMAVVMLAGNNVVFPKSLFGSFRTMTANIVLEMGYAGELQMGALIATACVLIVFVLIINVLFELIVNKNGGRNPKSKSGKAGAHESRITFYFKRITVRTAKSKEVLCYVLGSLSILSLILIVGFILINGLPNLTSEFLTGKFSYGGEPTILPSVIATLMLVALSLVIAVPIGIGAAVFLNEYAGNGFFVKLIRAGTQILAGIPSIIYGLFGMVFFSPLLSKIFGDKIGSTSILAGALTISLLIIPVIIRSTEESLKSVPDSYREGSLALGAGKARTIFKIVLPSAFPGILSAVILAAGRVVSESAPLMFTMGASLKAAPKSVLSSGTTLAVALYILAGEGLHIEQAYAAASVLLIMVLCLNLLSTFLAKRLQKKSVGVR